MKIQRMFTRALVITLMGVFLVGSSSLAADTKTYKWQPSSWLPSGISWDTIAYMSDYINRMSAGRMNLKPSAPGAIVPVAEQLDAVRMGVMQATFIWPGYFPGQLPIAFSHGDSFGVPKTIAEMRFLYEQYEGGRIMEILREEYAKQGVHLVGNVYWTLDNLIISKKPIRGIKDIKGLKFRSSELIALQLASLGAGTVWTPATEIYSMLSSGGVDAVTFSHAADDVAMGFHEVAKYWVKSPTAVGPAADAFIVNLKTWNSLPDDLKAILESACELGSGRNKFEAELKIAEAWKVAEKKGVEAIEWSDEDARLLAGTAREVVPKKYFDDKAFKEIFTITEKWATEKEYWDKK